MRGLLRQAVSWGAWWRSSLGPGPGGEAVVAGIQAPSRQALGSALGGAERHGRRETFRIGWGMILQIGCFLAAFHSGP